MLSLMRCHTCQPWRWVQTYSASCCAGMQGCLSLSQWPPLLLNGRIQTAAPCHDWHDSQVCSLGFAPRQTDWSATSILQQMCNLQTLQALRIWTRFWVLTPLPPQLTRLSALSALHLDGLGLSANLSQPGGLPASLKSLELCGGYPSTQQPAGLFSGLFSEPDQLPAGRFPEPGQLPAGFGHDLTALTALDTDSYFWHGELPWQLRQLRLHLDNHDIPLPDSRRPSLEVSVPDETLQMTHHRRHMLRSLRKLTALQSLVLHATHGSDGKWCAVVSWHVAFGDLHPDMYVTTCNECS